MGFKRILQGMLAIAVVAAGAGTFWANRHGEIGAAEPRSPTSFAAELIKRGESLAAIGDCAVCHTRLGGKTNAGGLGLETPFGVVYSTNITPDVETGIGTYTEEAFVRAMRQGVGRRGRHLYPVFPYDHFTKVTDEDLSALYAYLMSRAPVREEARANELSFPFNVRMFLAGWKLLYLDEGVFEPDPDQDEEWNRGAYLVEGLGHCGACHTPRNWLGAEIKSRALASGEADGWHSPALDGASPARVPWTLDAMVNYLIDGWDQDHGVSAGPMTPVVNNLAELPEDEIYAIAAYIKSQQARPEVDAAAVIAEAKELEYGAASYAVDAQAGAAHQRGEATFQRACANCHAAGKQTVPLALTSTVTGPDPRNSIYIILDGIEPPHGAPERSMPRFGSSLTDEQLADILLFMRAHFTRLPPWTDLAERITEARSRRAR